jgi:hypothetical protein
MRLLTKELESRFAQLDSQESKGDEAVVVAKFFTPDSCWTWLATEYDPNTREFFGLVIGLETELGYFSLDELESVKGPLGLPVERDLYWKEMPLWKAISRHAASQAYRS